MRCEFSKAVKAAAAMRAAGNCEQCTRKLMTGDYHFDHDIPDALGGEPTLENCRVLCRSCHKVKTSMEDVPRIAKSKRVRRRHIGIRKRSAFACSKDSPFRKKINGQVVRR